MPYFRQAPTPALCVQPLQLRSRPSALPLHLPAPVESLSHWTWQQPVYPSWSLKQQEQPSLQTELEQSVEITAGTWGISPSPRGCMMGMASIRTFFGRGTPVEAEATGFFASEGADTAALTADTALGAAVLLFSGSFGGMIGILALLSCNPVTRNLQCQQGAAWVNTV